MQRDFEVWAYVCFAVLILGVMFYVTPAHPETVIASTYNDGTVDANGMIAAHKTLRFGSKLTLSHGHRKIVVTILDRGPFIRGRTLDLTPAANKALLCGGLCRVVMESWPPLPRPKPPQVEAMFQWGEE